MSSRNRFRKADPKLSEVEVIDHSEEQLYPHTELIQEIKDTADKLAADGATRGDLKILSLIHI